MSDIVERERVAAIVRDAVRTRATHYRLAGIVAAFTDRILALVDEGERVDVIMTRAEVRAMAPPDVGARYPGYGSVRATLIIHPEPSEEPDDE